MWRKIILAIVILLVLGGAGYAYYVYSRNQTQTTEASPAMQTAVARSGDLVVFASGAGQVAPARQVGVGFSEAGVLAEVLVAVGQKVSQGEVLARLKTNETEESITASIADAQQNLVTAQQALDALYVDAPSLKAAAMEAIISATQALKDAQYQLDNYTPPTSQAGMDPMEAFDLMSERLQVAREAFEPYRYYPAEDSTRQQLLEALNAAQSEYNSAVKRLEYVYAVKVAQANLDAARQDYEKHKDGPDPDELALAQIKVDGAQAKLALAQEAKPILEMTAPMDGTVLSISANVGENVGTSAIIELGDLEKPVLQIYLDESDVDKVVVGYDAEVTFDAYPDQTFTGKVIELNPSLVTVSGVQVIQALVQLDDTGGRTFVVGLNATVDVIAGRAVNAVLVPVEALREIAPGEYAVFIVLDGEPKLRVVTIGLQDYTSVEIKEGLSPGDIVTTGIAETQ